MDKVCETITVEEDVRGFHCCHECDADEALERVKYYLSHCTNGTVTITFETKIESEA